MPKVTQPLFSRKASGDLGGVLQFRCGKFVVIKSKRKGTEATGEWLVQMEKFKDGADVWKNTLTPEQKESWESFSKSVLQDQGYFTISIPLGPVYVRIGRKENWKECIEGRNFNGYQYFQCCYLRFGPDGWNDYPNPPSFP